MRIPAFRLLLVLLALPMSIYAQGAAARSSTQATESIAHQESVSLREFMERQEKNYEKLLEAQKNLSDQAIQAVMREQITLQTVTQLGGFFLLFFSVVAGWAISKQFKNFNQLSKDTNIILENVKSEQAKIEHTRNVFESEIGALKQRLEALKEVIEKTENSVDFIEEHKESLEQIVNKADLANLRSALASANVEVRQQAALDASSFVTRKGGAMFLPVLLEFLQRADESPEVLYQALFGIGQKGQFFRQDKQAIGLILSASRSLHPNVRFVAIETMSKIGVTISDFQKRIKEMCDQDEDAEVKTKACEVLSKIPASELSSS